MISSSDFESEFSPRKMKEWSEYELENISIFSLAIRWQRPFVWFSFSIRICLNSLTISGIIFQNSSLLLASSSENVWSFCISYKYLKTSSLEAKDMSTSLISFNNIFDQFLKAL